jgi:Na+-driven multidrug efflux pump
MYRQIKENRGTLATLLLLAWPTVLEQLLSTVIQYIDTAMVGHLGADATATVSLSSTYTWLINSMIYAIGIGFLSYIARAVG